MTPSARRAVGRVALVAALLGVAALVAAATGGGLAVKPVPPDPPDRRSVWASASQSAFGRRVLLITGRPGSPRVGGIFESGRAPEGWALYAATSRDAPSLEKTLWDLAQRAAETFDTDRRRCPDDVERALDLFAVKVVLFDPVDAGHRALLVERPRAEPVAFVDGALPSTATLALTATDAVALAAALPTSEALFLDWDDGLWGGELTVEASRAGSYVFPFAVEGARVTVDGVGVSPQRAGPLVLLTLPAGRPRVVVNYDETGGQSWLPLFGGLALVVGVLGFLFAARPTAEEMARAVEERERSNG